MKISARNKLAGKVVGLNRGAVNSVVKIELQGTSTITAVITNDAVDELELVIGSEACAVVKASDVIVAVGDERPNRLGA